MKTLMCRICGGGAKTLRYLATAFLATCAAGAALAVDSLEETRGSVPRTDSKLAFKGVTLDDIGTKYYIRARMNGGSFDCKRTEAMILRRDETKDGDTLTQLAYDIQAYDYGSDTKNLYVKGSKLYFTNGVDGVYAWRTNNQYYTSTLTKFGGNVTSLGSTGSTGYDPYALQLVKPVQNSININFTKGKDLTGGGTRASNWGWCGAGDYIVPFGEWVNVAFDSYGTKTVSGDVTVTVEGPRSDSYSYSNNKIGTNYTLFHGYINDGKGNTTVTVDNVPYAKYRVVVLMANDVSDKKFGYVTVNGTDYCSSCTMSAADLKSAGDDFPTQHGTSTWGNTSFLNVSWLPIEGVNYLVSDVIEGSTTATIVTHSDESTKRGGIAAIQIVEVVDEVKPTGTYTADVDASESTLDLDSLDWDATLPDGDLSDCSLVLNVNGNATVNFPRRSADAWFPVSSITFNVAAGATLRLAGQPISSGDIFVNGGTVVTSGTVPLKGTLKGDGTVVYGPATFQGTVFTANIVMNDEDWSGVVWIKGSNIGWSVMPSLATSANSTLRLTGCNGYLNKEADTQVSEGTLDLVDEEGVLAFTVSNGYSGGVSQFSKLTGSGTLYLNNNRSPTQRYVFEDASEFTGTITVENDKYKVIFGDDDANAREGAITISAGATVTVPDGKAWSANKSVVVNGTLVLGDGASVNKVVYSSGTISVTDGTGTLYGYGESAAVTLATADGATLVLDESTRDAVTVSGLNNLGTIDFTQTALTTFTVNLPQGETTVVPGAIDFPDTFTAFVVVPADTSIRSLAGYEPPTGFELPSGASYYVQLTETHYEFANGDYTITDVPAGVKVRLSRGDGTTLDLEPDQEGVVTVSAPLSISGAATAFDYTYTNTTDYAYRATGWNVGWNADTKPMTFNNEAADDTTGVYIKHHPWYTNIGSKINSLDEFSVVVVGTMSPSQNTIFIHFGNSNNTDAGIIITTTGEADVVLIAKTTGASVDTAGGVKAAVLNAATARHAYVINKKGTIFEVWVDGVKRGQFNAGEGYRLAAGGIQVGSDHGGAIHGGTANNGEYRAVEVNDIETGCLNVLRFFDYPLSAEQTQLVFDTYPFVSQGGVFTRTVAADGDFSATDAWAKDGEDYDMPESTTVDGVEYNPSATITVDAAATVEVNADVTIDTLKVEGSAALKFAADGEHTVEVKGAAIFNTPVVIEYGSVDISGAPVQLGTDGSLAFDCSGFDISGIYATTRFQLTGLVDRNDEKVTFVAPAAAPHRVVTFGYNTTGSCYEFTVAPDREPTTIYYKSGTFARGSDDLRVVIIDDEDNETDTIPFSRDIVVFNDSVAEVSTVNFGATLPDGAGWTFDNWTGTVALPAIREGQVGGLNLNNYGVAGSSVLVGDISGSAWISNEEVRPTIVIDGGGGLQLNQFSATYVNTIDKLAGEGVFQLMANGSSSGYQNGYFLVKDVSEFTGSITLVAPGLAIGAAKPSNPTTFGQIVLTTEAKVASGATWTAPNGIVLASADATLTVADGATVSVPTTSLADYIVVSAAGENGATVYSVAAKVAMIGETPYASIAAAVAEAQDGDTITLVADDRVTFSEGVYEMTIAKSLTIDGAGHTLYGVSDYAGGSGDHDVFIASTAGDVTIRNLTFADFAGGVANNMRTYPIWTSQAYTGTLTLDGVTARNFNRTAFNLNGGTVVVMNCTITCDNTKETYFQEGIGVYNANVTIYDTTITGAGSTLERWPEAACIQLGNPNAANPGTGTITVKGGSFSGDYAVIVASNAQNAVTLEGGDFTGALKAEEGEGGTIIVSGGWFDAALPAAYCAAGLEPTTAPDSVTGKYTVKLKWPSGWNNGSAPTVAMQTAYDNWVNAGNDPSQPNAEAAFLMGVAVDDYQEPVADITFEDGVPKISDIAAVNGVVYVKYGDSPTTVTTPAPLNFVGGKAELPTGAATARFYKLCVGYTAPTEP